MSFLRKYRQWTAMVAVALFLFSGSVQAGTVILNVDATQSSLALTGGAFGLPFTQQNPGSLSANFGGTIQADLTGGVFTFSGSSTITGIVNPTGPFTTFPNPIGSEPGNYGVVGTGAIPAFGIPSATINGVYKNLVLDITAGTSQNGSASVGGMIKFTGGVLDFGAFNNTTNSAVIGGSGTSNLQSASTANTSASLVSWDGTTLRIPVAFQTTGGNGRVENWSGSIIAAVPEPSSIALISLVGMVGLSYASIRSRRAKRLLS